MLVWVVALPDRPLSTSSFGPGSPKSLPEHLRGSSSIPETLGNQRNGFFTRRKRLDFRILDFRIFKNQGNRVSKNPKIHCTAPLATP